MAQDMLGSGALADLDGPLKDFKDKLGGPDGPMWFSAFKRFLHKENPWALKLIRQMTLTIGGVPAPELLKRLEDGDFYVSDWARDVMSKPAFTTLPEITEIELGWITVRDLGFTEEPTTEELFARIRELDALCPAEVGPHLRLADANQPKGTGFWVAMEQITGSAGDPGVFDLERSADGKRLLLARYACAGRRWDLEDVVVLRLRK